MSRRKTPSCAGSSDDNSFAWPSTAGILETPDRKRPRRSIDTTCSDYGLSTSFGSPESHQVPPSTSPLLKTPVQPGKSCIHLTPSPLSSFRVRQSVSGSLKLSNPNNATEVRFTGSSLARLSPVKIGQFNKSTSNGRPLAPIQSNASRCLNDTFRMDDSAYNSCNESSLLFDSFRDNRRRSSILETPSKLFKINQMSYEPNSSDLFFSTSTPVKACNFSIYRSNYIAEQPSGRLETCVTDNSDFMISPTRYLDPSPIKPPKPVEKIPVIAQSVARKLYPKSERSTYRPNNLSLVQQVDPFLQYSRHAYQSRIFLAEH
ncbi:hypothetical protein L596_004953 [Steinernema carpocapsae]|uniref:Uncharacterized protein n=1 Tax=Steinernema carpocapsae TaxID=34508 RepID=A0A4U8UYY1_STECR|nr:hypothetical protein L596_004953 [Steinernema carpocapsae]